MTQASDGFSLAERVSLEDQVRMCQGVSQSSSQGGISTELRTEMIHEKTTTQLRIEKESEARVGEGGRVGD
jgi:hypothetical protein